MTSDLGGTGLPGTLSCAEAEVSLGALVLGALDPVERRQVEIHVSSCPDCRESLAELAPLPGLLNRITATQAAVGLSPAPVTLLDAALARSSSARRARRQIRMVLTAAAAAAVAAVIAVGATVMVRGVGEGPPTAQSSTVTTPPSGSGSGLVGSSALWDGVSAGGQVHAAVVVTAQQPGARLALTLSGVLSGQRCDLVVESASGAREVTASWQATYGGMASVTGSTAIPPSQISRMLVTTPGGQNLVELRPRS